MIIAVVCGTTYSPTRCTRYLLSCFHVPRAILTFPHRTVCVLRIVLHANALLCIKCLHTNMHSKTYWYAHTDTSLGNVGFVLWIRIFVFKYEQHTVGDTRVLRRSTIFGDLSSLRRLDRSQSSQFHLDVICSNLIRIPSSNPYLFAETQNTETTQ